MIYLLIYLVDIFDYITGWFICWYFWLIYSLIFLVDIFIDKSGWYSCWYFWLVYLLIFLVDIFVDISGWYICEEIFALPRVTALVLPSAPIHWLWKWQTVGRTGICFYLTHYLAILKYTNTQIKEIAQLGGEAEFAFASSHITWQFYIIWQVHKYYIRNRIHFILLQEKKRFRASLRNS